MTSSVPPGEPLSALDDRLPAFVLDIVRAATLAPSPDNNQPWRFAWRGDRLFVFEEPSRRLLSDAQGMFSCMALGAAVENACVAARHAGHEPAVTWLGANLPLAGMPPAPIASIRLSPGSPDGATFRELPRRCTCRKPYSKEAPAPRILERLSAAAESLPGSGVFWLTARSEIRRAAWLVAAGDRLRFQLRSFHEELYRQLRFTAASVAATRDGLDVRTLELPPGGRLVLRGLRSWRAMAALNRIGGARLLTLPSAAAVLSSGAIGAISVADDSRDSFLNGGRAFERLWLAATQNELSLQPLGSVPIFLARLREQRSAGANGAPDQFRIPAATLEGLALRVRGLFPAMQYRPLLMLFRLGRSKAPRARSLRRPAASVLTAGDFEAGPQPANTGALNS